MLDLSKFEGPLPWECQTRDGRKARIICVDREDTREKPILALVKVARVGEVVYSYYTNGSFLKYRGENNLDLINNPEEIRPKPGELWEKDFRPELRCFILNDNTQIWVDGVMRSESNERMSPMIHGKNSWKRVYPPVEGE